VAVLLVLASAAVAPAQTSTEGTFGISPARRDIVGRPPASLMPTHIVNTTRTPYRVHVFSALLGQDITGAFTFGETPRDLAEGTKVLSGSPTDFTLSPGQSSTVAIRWNLLPLGTRAAYVGLIFQGTPQTPGRSVSVISRLLSANFLRLPGRYHSYGIFTALHATQFAPQVLRFLPVVKNTGDVVANPTHGRFAIRDASGKDVFRTPWKGDVVLPGYQRQFPIDVKPPHIIPAGSYTAVATMVFGANRHARITAPFTLVGPNTLPSPSLGITNLNGKGAIGDPAEITAQVASTGTAPVSVTLTIDLAPIVNGIPATTPVATKKVAYDALAPKSTRNLDEFLGKLSAGDWQATLSYTDPTGAPQRLVTDFQATKRLSFLDRIWRWVKDHRVLLIVLAALILLAAVIRYMLRRQRRLEAALRAAQQGRGPVAPASPVAPPAPVAPPPAPPLPAAPVQPPPAPPPVVAPPPAPTATGTSAAPSAPTSGAALDLNTATAEQLQEVPGIGPAAARRIVAYREEYGRFASIDALAQVEGFDAERVAGLRGRLRA
jgi:competence ComEA-like helix-hairpin-helix protein